MFARSATTIGWLKTFFEMVGGYVLGRPIRIVPADQLERLTRLEFRERLREAERCGNITFLREQLAKVQLTQADLDKLARGHTPLEEWPDEPDLFTPHEPTQDDAKADSFVAANI